MLVFPIHFAGRLLAEGRHLLRLALIQLEDMKRQAEQAHQTVTLKLWCEINSLT